MNNFTDEERDHIALMQMVTQKIQEQKPYVLKGGTALMLAYGLDRFSEDLDFDVYSDFKGSHKANLSSVLKNIKENNFKVRNISIRKDTDTVNRYRLNYQNSLNNEASLKIEISYRTPLDRENAIFKNGIYVLPIEKIAGFKINSVLDMNNDSRTKARDLYDANFIIKNYPNAVSDEQITNLLNINMDNLEVRYKDSFEEDRILSKNKDLSVVILELSEISEQIAKDRKLGKYQSDDISKSNTLKQQLTKDNIKKDHPTISDNNAKAIELFINTQLAKYHDKPNAQQAILEQIQSKLPDIASGKISLPDLPNQDKEKGR